MWLRGASAPAPTRRHARERHRASGPVRSGLAKVRAVPGPSSPGALARVARGTASASAFRLRGLPRPAVRLTRRRAASSRGREPRRRRVLLLRQAARAGGAGGREARALFAVGSTVSGESGPGRRGRWRVIFRGPPRDECRRGLASGTVVTAMDTRLYPLSKAGAVLLAGNTRAEGHVTPVLPLWDKPDIFGHRGLSSGDREPRGFLR